MTPKYLTAPGAPITFEDIRCPKAKDLARFLGDGKAQFATFVELSRDGSKDIVVFDVVVERPQLRTHNVARVERLAASFDERDVTIPEVLALRSDFPRVPHLQVHYQELPRRLCLYDESYDELKLRWTSAAFVERVRQWLALTAKGKLHQDDQPLESLFLHGMGELVVPHDLFDREQNQVPERLVVGRVSENGERLFLLAGLWPAGQERTLPKDMAFGATVIVCPPREHGVIHCTPATLHELNGIMLKESGFDLVAALRERFKGWQGIKGLENAGFVLIIAVPTTRTEHGMIEAHDIRAFVTVKKLREVGESIDAWQMAHGHRGTLLGGDATKTGKDVFLDMLNVRFTLSRSMAAHLNGLKEPYDKTVVAVGLGALGSQVYVNLLRAGVGRWTLIDEDRLLPHNLARHALYSFVMGMPKVESLAAITRGILAGEEAAATIVCDALNPGDKAETLRTAFTEADVILDMSASAPVARHVALVVEGPARRASVFLNPTGTDLVILAEDAKREFRLDALEAQFYRLVATDPRLAGHFPPSQERIRYGRSCRDITSTLPQSLVALHAGIAAHAIEQALRQDSATIGIWRVDRSSMAVDAISIVPQRVVINRCSDWSLVTDVELLAKLSKMRQERLPNETGGVLIGTFDLEHKVAYVTDALPSPPDSEEWPTLYIRGCHGLKPRVDAITDATQGALEYVGEWHSHPDACSVRASSDDVKVFTWLTERMDAVGLPALMMIVGDGQRYGCHLGKIVCEDDAQG